MHPDVRAHLLSKIPALEHKAETIIEEKEIKQEYKDLLSEKNFLTKLLSSKSLQKKEIDNEIDFLIKKFKDDPLLGKRRTKLDKFGSVNEETFDNEIKSDDPLTITVLKNGFVKSQKSFVKNLEEQIGNENSSLLMHARSNEKIILASNFGKFYTIEADNIAEGQDDEILTISLSNATNAVLGRTSANLYIYDPDTNRVIYDDYYGSFDAETLTFTISEGIKYNPRYEREDLPAPISFTASEWTTNMIKIIDEGQGFKEKDTSKIFRRFYSNRPDKFGEHSGLGLNIVKNLVDLHDGEIVASNRLDRDGAIVEIKFPSV